MRTSIIIASAMSFSIVGAAHAQPPRVCEIGGVCVYDQHGFIGVLVAPALPVLVQKLDRGVSYAIEFAAKTGVPVATAEYVYPNATCAGPPYMYSVDASFPPAAFADNNHVMWSAGEPVVEINVGSYLIPGQGGCVEYRWGPVAVGPAMVVDSTVVKSWAPPFTIDPPNQRQVRN